MKVSVIIPTFNYAQYITTAIKSVLEQGTNDIEVELIVVDDGSTDNTDHVVHALGVPGLIYIKQKNVGKANATKIGISQATGKYIFNLDADDFFLPGKIEKTVKVFEMSPEVVHVATPAFCINEKVNHEYVESVPSMLFKENNGIDTLLFFYENKILFGGGSTFAARADLLKSIAIDDDIDMYIDEYLVLATLSHGNTHFLSEPLSVWRIHEGNYSGGNGNLGKRSDRLLKSSLGVLKGLGKLPLPASIVLIYKLQHRIREMVFKEGLNQKSLGDIVRFFLFLVSSGYSLFVLRHYSAFARLIPSGILNFLKR